MPFRKDEKKWSLELSSRVNSIFHVRSREVTAENGLCAYKGRSAENGVSFFGQMHFSSSGDTAQLGRHEYATGLTNGRARERVSVLNAFSMGW